MNSVLDGIQRKLSSSHWHVGPIEDVQVNNDLRATADFNLMEEGEELAIATAAAAAAQAMQHERQRRSSRCSGSASRPRMNSQRHQLRALAAKQRERVEEVIQDLRLRAPEVAAKQREKVEEVIQIIKERTLKMKERTPEVLEQLREFVREQLSLDDSINEDCDAAGRKSLAQCEYNNSLMEEEREQPPSASNVGRRMKFHSNEAWKRLCQPQKPDTSEIYVNLGDGDSHDAVSGTMHKNSASARRATTTPNLTGYANMNDPLDVKRHSPIVKREVAHVQAASTKDSVRCKTRPKSQHEWGASHSYANLEEAKEVSACEEPAKDGTTEPARPSRTEALHSTANYHWGATRSSDDSTSEQTVVEEQADELPIKEGPSSSRNDTIPQELGRSPSAEAEPLIELSPPGNHDNKEAEMVESPEEAEKFLIELCDDDSEQQEREVFDDNDSSTNDSGICVNDSTAATEHEDEGSLEEEHRSEEAGKTTTVASTETSSGSQSAATETRAATDSKEGAQSVCEEGDLVALTQ